MFDYFYKTNAEQFIFYRIPKVLFTEKRFKKISCEAKVLYGLMLDRMGLSMKNQWVDKENRVYIIFTVEEIVDLLGCGTQKVVKLLDELDSKKGIGLIERRRLGLGRPNRIYVKNFISEMKDEKIEDSGKMGQVIEGENYKILNCENQNSRNVNNKNQEFPRSQNQDCENQNLRIMKKARQDWLKSQSINTEFSNTEISDIKNTSSTSIRSPQKEGEKSLFDSDQFKEYQKNRENIEYAIGFDSFQDPVVKNQVDEIVDLMTEIFLLPPECEIRIGQDKKIVKEVQERLKKLQHEHIVYVIESLEEASKNTRIRNVRSYILTSLFNAPVTITNYYANRAIYDMHMPNDAKKNYC